VPRGGWLVQSAAGSALGRMIIRLSKVDGFRTVNLVRRREQGDELRRLGADEIICTSEESIAERVKAITAGAGARYALDCVGGDTGAGIARALGEEGHMLIYGTLSNEPIAVDPRIMITTGARIEGFWLGKWARAQGPLKMLKVFGQINRLMKEGVLTSDIGATFPLDEVQSAVKQAEQVARGGKVLLRIGK
jgi:NADPH2:quinone reductase